MLASKVVPHPWMSSSKGILMDGNLVTEEASEVQWMQRYSKKPILNELSFGT